jgi:hypothetical protein
MGWPAIPKLLFTDSVTLYATTHGKDVAGGKTQSNLTRGGTYACAVMAASANDQAAHSRETQIISHVVTAVSQIGRYQDVLIWNETGASLTIVAIEPAGDGRGRIYNHYCEEHPIR